MTVTHVDIIFLSTLTVTGKSYMYLMQLLTTEVIATCVHRVWYLLGRGPFVWCCVGGMVPYQFIV